MFYVLCYALSSALSRLNRKIYWGWYKKKAVASLMERNERQHFFNIRYSVLDFLQNDHLGDASLDADFDVIGKI